MEISLLIFSFNFRGFFPKGGGEVNIKVTPSAGLRGVTLMDQGTVTRVYGISFVAGVIPKKVQNTAFCTE